MYYKKGQEVELLNGQKRKVICVAGYKDGRPEVLLVETGDPMYKEAIVFIKDLKA